MPTLEDLVTGIEVEAEQNAKRQVRAQAQVKEILARAKREGRSTLTADEDRDVEESFAIVKRCETDATGIEQRMSIAKRAQAQEQSNDMALLERHADPRAQAGAKPAYDQVARVGNEERTYHKGNCRSGGLFIRDILSQHLTGDLEASQRLSRHQQEERVERGEYMTRATTSAFTGLVVPQYLTDMYAPAIAALRPFADSCNPHELPSEGMTVNIQQITTATSVGLQTTQNSSTGIGNTDIAGTLLTENVQTAAGTVTLSRQLIERGIGTEDVTMNDLQRQYATNLDSTLLNQATTGLSALGVATSFASTAPTGPALYPKILGALAGSEAALLAQATPNVAIMHSRRWYWLNSQMTSTWPMINQPGFPAWSAGVNEAVGYNRGVRGYLPNGLGVIVDNNVGTAFSSNQDEIYVAATDECHLWEDPNAPQFIRAEQPTAGTLGVQLVLYGYFAYCFRRYANAVQKINGTGLTTPTF